MATFIRELFQRSTDYALDELRRVEKDLEINLKITECLSKLNRHNHEKNEHNEKRRYIKRYQESLYHKYLKKIQVRINNTHIIIPCITISTVTRHSKYVETVMSKYCIIFFIANVLVTRRDKIIT